jgi:phenylpropionate dioxygenase-like ring-hydroxylating dioxygenase large terminal subunit
MNAHSTNGVEDVLASLANIGNIDAGQARSLPTGFYTSEEHLEIEKEEVFRKEWICLGLVAEIPKCGDYFTTQLLDEPLIVARGQDKKVRVLSNVCRHRSSVIVEGTGNTKHFVCPYHAWTYANDGQLLRAPYMDQVKGFKVEGRRLPEFKTEVWHGFLYVNLDGKAKPLAPRLKELEPYLENRHLEDMVVHTVLDEVWPTNWKCLAENYMEGYHLNTVHSKALYDITPTRLCEKIPPGEGFTGYKSNYTSKTLSTKNYHPDVKPEERRFSIYFWVFPSHVASIMPDGCSLFCLQPRGVDETANRCLLSSYEQPSVRQHALRLKSRGETMDEDREQLERMRRGLKSRYVQPSRLGPANLEGTVWDMYQYMARQLAPKTNRRARLKHAS